jgi:hypothetical protein
MRELALFVLQASKILRFVVGAKHKDWSLLQKLNYNKVLLLFSPLLLVYLWLFKVCIFFCDCEQQIELRSDFLHPTINALVFLIFIWNFFFKAGSRSMIHFEAPYPRIVAKCQTIPASSDLLTSQICFFWLREPISFDVSSRGVDFGDGCFLVTRREPPLITLISWPPPTLKQLSLYSRSALICFDAATAQKNKQGVSCFSPSSAMRSCPAHHACVCWAEPCYHAVKKIYDSLGCIMCSYVVLISEEVHGWGLPCSCADSFHVAYWKLLWWVWIICGDSPARGHSVGHFSPGGHSKRYIPLKCLLEGDYRKSP